MILIAQTDEICLSLCFYLVRVTSMEAMFSLTRSSNGPLSNWDVSRVTSMARMFRNATSFNGDISGWDVSRVKSMNDMFHDVKSFNDCMQRTGAC